MYHVIATMHTDVAEYYGIEPAVENLGSFESKAEADQVGAKFVLANPDYFYTIRED